MQNCINIHFRMSNNYINIMHSLRAGAHALYDAQVEPVVPSACHGQGGPRRRAALWARHARRRSADGGPEAAGLAPALLRRRHLFFSQLNTAKRS